MTPCGETPLHSLFALSFQALGACRAASHDEAMTSTIHQLNKPTTSLVTRTLDAVDRAHARAAMLLHDVRNDVRSTVERGIDRAEELTTSVFDRARRSIQKVDVVSADVVNRAQGVVGQAIEKARLARSKPEHVTH